MYTALYGAYRPEVFDEILGQDHIVRILKNQIQTDTYKSCIFVLRNARYRKDYNGKDPGQGTELYCLKRAYAHAGRCSVCREHQRGHFS